MQYNGCAVLCCAALLCDVLYCRTQLPIIHIYAFSKCVATAHTAVADIAERCAGVMQCPISHLGTQTLIDTADNFISVIMMQEKEKEQQTSLCFGHIVRNVSPKKVMVCLSFRLPQSVADS
jgi:hypothetical protein